MTTPQVPPLQMPQPSTPPMRAPASPPYGWYPPPVNMYAILSLVFALAVFAPLGIYFGNKAKRQIAQSGERGIELAKAGLICGWIFSVIQGLILIVWCGFGAVLIARAGH